MSTAILAATPSYTPIPYQSANLSSGLGLPIAIGLLAFAAVAIAVIWLSNNNRKNYVARASVTAIEHPAIATRPRTNWFWPHGTAAGSLLGVSLLIFGFAGFQITWSLLDGLIGAALWYLIIIAIRAVVLAAGRAGTATRT